jgi:hypothetical protein
MAQQTTVAELSTPAIEHRESDVDALDGSKRRAHRARTEKMIVIPQSDPEGACTGIYDVLSRSGEVYSVVLDIKGACQCEDMLYNQPEGGCKHRRRVALGITANGLPAPGADVSDYLDRLGRAYEAAVGAGDPREDSALAVLVDRLGVEL